MESSNAIRFNSNANYTNKYRELETQYKAAIIDKYLELKMIRKFNSTQISDELSTSSNKINQYKKDLGYQSNRKPIKYTPEQRMEMSLKMKIAHKYRKDFKNEMEKVDSVRDSISAEEYNKLVKEISDKYNLSKVNSNDETTKSTNKNKKTNKKKSEIRGGMIGIQYQDVPKQEIVNNENIPSVRLLRDKSPKEQIDQNFEEMMKAI
jgi:hypothetical protein